MIVEPQTTGPNHRSVEKGVTVGIAVFALIVLGGSIQAGIGWGAEGPKAGFFPFYIGLLILIASVVNFVQINATVPRDRLFVEWGQLSLVMTVVVPTTIYVALVPYTGIYVASALLIAFFMKRLGRYQWTQVAATSIMVPLLIFAIFEKWFLVPLPKGPIEEFLGF
jgi:putative tricarboxylic transport membrane protein